MITLQQAFDLVDKKFENKNLKKHVYAVSAIMRQIAEVKDKDTELWEITGLLHDIDFEETKNMPEKHAIRSSEILEGQLPIEALHAILAHNHTYTGIVPEKDIDYALISADAISGLVVATALVMPNKKLSDVKEKSILKKFADNAFAKNIDRDRILYCKSLGMSKEEFIEISLMALQKIHEKLGL